MTIYTHECGGDLPESGYGPAIDGCFEDSDGMMWAGNGEYGSQVLFCPYCGTRAKVLPPRFESELTVLRRNHPGSPWAIERAGMPDLCAERLDKIYQEDQAG